MLVLRREALGQVGVDHKEPCTKMFEGRRKLTTTRRNLLNILGRTGGFGKRNYAKPE